MFVLAELGLFGKPQHKKEEAPRSCFFFCIRRSMEMRCEDVPADEDAVVHYYLREEVQ